MKILVINGPNLNMLGVREPDVYGTQNYRALCRFTREAAARYDARVKIRQSNSEGEIVGLIQKARGKFDGILINPAAYTHTSIAILDALKAVSLPTVEVHLSDPGAREEFRQTSYVSLFAKATVSGKGFESYADGLRILTCTKE